MQVKETIETKNIYSSIWVPSSRLKLLHTLKVAQVPSVIIHSNSRSGLRSIHRKSRGGGETNEKEGQIPRRSNSTRSSYYSFYFFLSRFMYIHVQWSTVSSQRSIRLTSLHPLTSLCEPAQYSLEEQTRLESGFSRRQTSVGGNKREFHGVQSETSRVFFFFFFNF